jgi:menaquinone-9 beta-reductase
MQRRLEMDNQSKIENPKSKIVIVGGGPAGASLAIRLVEKGFETVLLEKDVFPREKLCGEFISPECLAHFSELGVMEPLLAAGGDRVYRTRFFETGGRSIDIPSSWFGSADSFALGLSRAEMDFQLLKRAKEVGARVFEGTTVTDLVFDGHRAVRIVGRSEGGQRVEEDADIFVDATGRSAVLARRATRNSTVTKRSSIVGFKSHIAGAAIENGVCEIYSFPGGYAGLSNVEGDRANLCFLVRSDVVKTVGNDASRIVDLVVRKNRRAASTLGDIRSSDWLAVAISGFGTKQVAAGENTFSVGDAAAFIDPFTGSGMVMAFQSAKLLATAIERSRYTPRELPQHYTDAYRRHFARRLRVCSVLRRTAFMPRLATFAVRTLGISTAARRLVARSTRGG